VHDPTKALAHHEANHSAYLEDLKELVRIPSVSFKGFPEEEVRRSADAVAALLRAAGFADVATVRDLAGVERVMVGRR
jgi:acetylornithine deacetylase/succinyl-diaminopimelate desuccinylase-like protein